MREADPVERPIRGPNNTITDVPGVLVGHATVIRGTGPLVVGKGPVRTGVTVLLPRGSASWSHPVYGGFHRLNGCGEVTGTQWLTEAGQIGGPIALTNTYSLGTVRDSLIRIASSRGFHGPGPWSLPIVGETWDGMLNDIEGQHLDLSHVAEAISGAGAGAIQQGNVGGGTGMTSFGFKGGIGCASRIVTLSGQRYMIGALVQSNFGDRDQLTIRGLAVGPLTGHVPLPGPEHAESGGSIIVVLATDVPLLPHMCDRVAQRASLGIARVGGTANNTSGDFAICFSTANAKLPPAMSPTRGSSFRVEALADADLTPLFKAAVDVTEAAIVNALRHATTLTGRDGVTAQEVPDHIFASALKGQDPI